MSNDPLARRLPSLPGTIPVERTGAARRSRIEQIAPLFVYAIASVVLIGRRVLADLAHSYIGLANWSGDPIAMMWHLAWWPHALVRQLNPFLTDAIYAPVGINLAWVTSIPGASLLVAPITLTWGPVVSYNIICLSAPPLAAFSAFVLCRYVTKAFWPSLAGGFVFGFSSYLLAHLLGQLHLILIALVPVFVYLVLLRLDNAISAPVFTLLLGLALAAQFSFSIEVVATLTLFGGALLLGVFLAVPDARRRLMPTILLIGYAYGVAVLVEAPYVFYLFARGFPQAPVFPPELFSSVLHNFIIPTPTTYVGQHWYDFYGSIAGKHPQVYDEETAYLGAPLLLIIVLFGLRNWRRPVGKLLVLSFTIVCLASLGPVLRVHGHSVLPLPWKLFTSLPVINHAMPAQFMMYAFLISGLIVAVWANDPHTAAWKRLALVLLAILSLLPNPTFFGWRTPLKIPAFFTDGAYARYLRQGETVVVIPYGHYGQSMLWQAETGIYFRMTDGYVGPVAPRGRDWPVMDEILHGRFPVERQSELNAFLKTHGVTAVVVAESTPGSWRAMLSGLDAQPVNVDGVVLYRVRPQ